MKSNIKKLIKESHDESISGGSDGLTIEFELNK